MRDAEKKSAQRSRKTKRRVNDTLGEEISPATSKRSRGLYSYDEASALGRRSSRDGRTFRSSRDEGASRDGRTSRSSHTSHTSRTSRDGRTSRTSCDGRTSRACNVAPSSSSRTREITSRVSGSRADSRTGRLASS